MKKLNRRQISSSQIRTLLAIAVVGIAGVNSQMAKATSYSWVPTGPGTFNWTDTPNWAPSTDYPGDTIGVTNDVALITPTASLGGAQIINYSGMVAPSIGTLTLTTVAASAATDSLTLNTNGVLNVTGPVTMTSGSNTVGRVTLNANAVTNFASGLTMGRATLIVNHSMNVASLTTTLGDNSVINANGGTLTVAGNFTLLSSGGTVSLTNGGIINVLGNLSDNIASGTINTLTPVITLTSGTMSVAGTYGDANFTGGLNLQGTGNFNLGGAYSTSAGAGSGNITVNTTGNVSFNTVNIGRTGGANNTLQAVNTNGFHVTNGNVSIVDLRIGTSNSSAVGEVNNGTLTVSGVLATQGNNGGGGRYSAFYMSGNGVLIDNNTAGAFIGLATENGTTGSAAAGAFIMNGGTATLEKLTMAPAQSSNFATPGTNRGSLTLNAGILYLGSGGLVSVNSAAVANVAMGSTAVNTLNAGTLAAKASWSSNFNANLTGAFTFQAADTASNPTNITLLGNFTGSGGIIKTGLGTLTMSHSANGYTGATVVNAGKLIFNPVAGTNIAGTGQLTVNANAIVAGSGLVTGGVIDNGGKIQPGISTILNGVGILSVAGTGLALNANSVIDFDFNGSGSANDLLNVTGGSVTIGGPVTFNIFNAGAASAFGLNGTYKLITNITPGTFVGNVDGSNVLTDIVFGNTDATYTHTFSYVTSTTNAALKDIVLTISGGVSNTKWAGTTDGDYGNITNWTNGIAAGVGANGNFDGSATTYAVNLNANRTLGNLSIDSGTNAGYTFAAGVAGSKFIMDNGTNNSAIAVINGTDTISAGIQLNSTGAITTSFAASTLTLSGAITGAGRLTVTGPGLVILSANNSYAGTTTIAALSQLVLGDGVTGNGTIGGGVLTNNGTLRFNYGVATISSAVIQGSGDVTTIGAGKVTLTGASSYSGNTTVAAASGGLVVDYSSGALSSNTTITAAAPLQFKGATGATQTFNTALTLQANSSLTVTGGTAGTMAVIFNGGSSAAGTIPINVDGTTGSAALTVGNFTLGNGTTVTVGGSFASTFTTSGANLGNGTVINANSGGGVTFSATTTNFNNGSAIHVIGGALPATLTVGGAVINSGAIVDIGNRATAVFGATAFNNGSVVTVSGGALGSQATFGASTFNGLTSLTLTGGASGGSVTLGTQTYNMRAEIGVGASSTLSIGAFSRGGTGAANITGAGSIVTSGANGVGGIVGGWATLNGSDFAAVSGTSIVAAPSVNNTWSGGNVSVTSNISPATGSVSSVRFKTNAGSTVTLTGLNTITSGAILVSSDVGANPSVINGGTLQPSAGQEIILNQRNTAGELDIGSQISQNTSASVLTKLGPGTVGLSGKVNITGITQVVEGTLRIDNSSVYTSGNGGLTIGSFGTVEVNGSNAFIPSLAGTGTVTSTTGGTLTLGSTGTSNLTNGLAGNLNFTKTGTGTVTLLAAANYTGITTINQGAIFLDYLNSAGAANFLPSTTGLVLGGGQLIQSSRANDGNILAAFAGTTLTLGASVVLQTARQANGALKITLGAITRNIGATADFQPQTSNGSLTSTTNANGDSGILGGWATANNGAEWARSSGSIQGGATYANTFAAATNTDMTVSIDQTATPDATTSSLRFNTGTAAHTLSLAGSNTITSGGILVTTGTGANASIITGGSITSGNAQDLIVIHNNSNAAGVLTIGSSIVDPAGGTIGLTKAGAGILALSAPNTYSGQTSITGGTLRLDTGSTLAAASPIVNNATLVLNHTDAITVGNVITGTGSLVQAGTGTVTLTQNLGLSSVTVSAGKLAVTADAGTHSAVVMTLNSLTITGGKFDLQNRDMIVKNSGSVTDDLAITSFGNLVHAGLLGGNGITSSAAIAKGNTTIGYGYASDFGISIFDGVAVNPSDIIVRYVGKGDANFDGKTDSADLNKIFSLLGGLYDGPYFGKGDLNGDGKVDAADLNQVFQDLGNLVGGDYHPLGGSESLADLGVGAVPEPASLMLLGLGGAALLTRRRRQH